VLPDEQVLDKTIAPHDIIGQLYHIELVVRILTVFNTTHTGTIN